MRLSQKIKKWLYPAFMKLGKSRFDTNLENTQQTAPATSIYGLNIVLNNGKTLSLEQFKGKKLLLVNTASDCGFTAQYDELQKLWKDYDHSVVVVGFPSNDFKEQEKASDADIAAFCRLNYGVDFPLAAKSTVLKTPAQNQVYQWLTDPSKNGWNHQAPVWNFSKYLINEEGILTHVFGPAISPLSNQVITAIQSK